MRRKKRAASIIAWVGLKSEKNNENRRKEEKKGVRQSDGAAVLISSKGLCRKESSWVKVTQVDRVGRATVPTGKVLR